MENELRFDLIILGRVQNVGYRYYTKIKADSLNIRGSVKNMRDGTVFVIAQCQKNAMENFLKCCFVGPRGAIVSKIDKVGVKQKISEDSLLFIKLIEKLLTFNLVLRR